MGLLALACSRTGLEPGDLGAAADPLPSATTMTAIDAGGPRPGPTSADAGSIQPNETSRDPNCVPSAEACNGVDDDCNGAIDDVPAVACASGGFSYCVAGQQSACPSRCETCIPGSERVCFTSYCTFWGTQTCTADGRSFGSCHEHRVPSECAGAAGNMPPLTSSLIAPSRSARTVSRALDEPCTGITYM